MADGINKCILVGNVGADPVLSYTQANRAKLLFRMATTETWKDDTGERKEHTCWHSVLVWGKRAEALSKFISKGTRVYVEGRIDNRSYDDKDGVKKYVSEIVMTELLLLDGRPSTQGGERSESKTANGGGGYSRGGYGGTGAPKTPPAERDEIPPDDFGGGGTDDDQIPFARFTGSESR